MVRNLGLLGLLCMLIAACGVRGDLQPPEGVPSIYPQQYPAQN